MVLVLTCSIILVMTVAMFVVFRFSICSARKFTLKVQQLHKNLLNTKKKTINDGGYNKSDLVHPEEDSSVNREYWIKTDADCKYTKIFHWPISQFNLCYVFKFFIGPL